MNNELEVFQDILFISCPWQLKEESEHKYIQNLQTIPKELAGGFGLYEIKFPKPLSARRKYYYRIIENEAANYLNQTRVLLTNASAENEKKYIVDKVLSKRLNTKLYEVAKVIAENNLTYDLIKQTTLHSNQNPKLKEDAFIIQFLKYQLLWLYLEVQDTYAGFVTSDIYTKEELHEKFFSENLPDDNLIVIAPEINRLKVQTQFATIIERESLIVREGDFRKPEKHVLSFEALIKNSNKFGLFEEQLYGVDLIDKDYNFIDKHTHKQYLAAIYHALIQKNYFNKKAVGKPNVEDVDIRKFLDHRYNAKLDGQFRIWHRNREKLADFIQKHPWIKQLPTS